MEQMKVMQSIIWNKELECGIFHENTTHKGFSFQKKKRSTLWLLKAVLTYGAFYSHIVGCMPSYLIQQWQHDTDVIYQFVEHWGPKGGRCQIGR